jgi:hypothetical protein
MFKERFKDAKREIKIPLKKEIQHNGQKKNNNRTNSNLQNITQKTKDRKRTTLKTR